MNTLIGKTISHYRILEQIGAGGMGEVYRAHDLRLERDVALKVLPSGILADEAVRRRFRREALALSKLNHPNIATVFDFDTQGGVDFLVMELVSGETLVGKLGRGPLPEGDVSRLGLELAEGLGAAHAHGVIHRDLKPGNVRLMPDGRLKILDFGLARLVRPVSDVGATSTDTMTEVQGVVGTLPYMPPEQVRGDRVDARSDIWAAGAVLYEMATGRRAFPESEAARVIAAILQEAPRPPRGVNGQVSAGLEGIILKCLEKDPGNRYQSAKELAADLRRLSSVAGVRSIARSRLVIAAAVVGVFALVAVVLLRTGTGPIRMTPPTWRQLTFIGNAMIPTLSPDGKTIACILPAESTPWRVVTKDIDGGRAIEIARVNDVNELTTLRWSPTGEDLLLGSTMESSLLHRMGGTSRVLPLWGCILALSPDGSTVAAAWPLSKRIELRGVIGADTSSIPLAAEFTWFKDVDWAPDGKMLLFSVSDPSRYSIWTVRRDGTHQQKVYEDSATVSCPRWAPQGGGIYCIRDLGRKKEVLKIYVSADGGPSRRAQRVLVSEPELGSPFAVSRDGHRLVCTRTSGHSNIWLWPRGVRAGAGMAQPHQLTEGTALISDVTLSPDATRVAYLTNESGVQNVHVFSLADSADFQLTFMKRDVMDCAWSPDGRHIAFTVQDGDTVRVWAVPARGGTPMAFRHSLVSESGGVAWAPGREILHQVPGDQSLSILDPVTGSSRPLLPNNLGRWIDSPAWSPDQEHVAMTVSGHNALFVVTTAGTVRGLPVPAHGSPRWDSAGVGILAWVGNSIVRVSYPAFKTTTVSSLPSRNISALDFTPDLQTMVYTIDETNSDVWLVENFDPDVK